MAKRLRLLVILRSVHFILFILIYICKYLWAMLCSTFIAIQLLHLFAIEWIFVYILVCILLTFSQSILLKKKIVCTTFHACAFLSPLLCSYLCFLFHGPHSSVMFLTYESCLPFLWNFYILSFVIWCKKK